MADERPVGVRFAEPVAEEEKEETDAFIEHSRASFDTDPEERPSKHATVSRLNKSALIPWILTGLFALTSFLLLLERYGIRKFGTYEDRLETDLKSLSHVPMERRRFVGSPRFDENGTMYTPAVELTAEWPENKRFTGEPSEEVDENWDHLLKDRYFSVSDSEAEVAWGDRRREYVDEVYGGYTAGLDVFHTLHCLNQVRKALHPEYYDVHGLPVEVDQAHTDHCIDTIRQHIQCYGSTTLVPTKWREGAQRQYIDSNQEHVCRDFSYLRKYMKRRSQGGDLYVARDKKLLGMAKAWEEAWEDNGEPH